MTENKDKKNISKHILPTSSNLLGLCFVLIGLMKVWNVASATIIDEVIGVVIAFFLAASILSYASMRSRMRSEFYEKIADMIFLGGLCLLAIIAMVIIFEVV